MPYDPESSVFTSIEDFYAYSSAQDDGSTTRIVHCVNPFPAKPGTEHHRAQQVTLASMDRARKVAGITCPETEVVFAKVTLEQDEVATQIEFDTSADLSRTVLDIGPFKTPRPLPLIMDVLTAVDLDPQDIFVFTNVDIALTPEFYAFIHSLFARGADCAIINRRTISGVYRDESDLSIMACEVGEAHPGFDCFAFRGHLRNGLAHYDSCVGIGGVMLPLLHQLLAAAQRPVVLLDAHATYHLGNDQQWMSDAFDDYAEHNRTEIDRVFKAILGDASKKDRLLARLSGAARNTVLPRRLRGLVANEVAYQNGQADAGQKGLLSKLQSAFRR